jgi:hypothetical protein
MAKKHDSKKAKSQSIYDKIGNMRVVELQASCIMRGLDFTDVVEWDFGKLASWLIKNYDKDSNRDLLEDFDIWVDGKLEGRGYEENDPIRQFRKFSNLDDEQNPQVKTKALKKAGVPKKKRTKKERNGLGIFKGTKKEYTYSLAKSLIEKYGDKYTNKEISKKFSSQLFNKVLKKYSDAKDKSVKIWMKRALDGYRK